MTTTKESFMRGFRHAEEIYRIPKHERVSDAIEQTIEVKE